MYISKNFSICEFRIVRMLISLLKRIILIQAIYVYICYTFYLTWCSPRFLIWNIPQNDDPQAFFPIYRAKG